MNTRLNIRVILFLPLIIIMLGMASCAQEMRDFDSSENTPNTIKVEPSNTPSPYPPDLSFTPEISTTPMPEDDRQNSYIFPSQIDQKIA